MEGKREYIDAKLERRKNKNRGYRKLRAWRQAIELYALICEKVKEIPGHPHMSQLNGINPPKRWLLLPLPHEREVFDGREGKITRPFER